MHKIIHSSFELDLTSYKLSTVEENHWFNDQFFTKYSFPAKMYLTDELIEVFGELLDDNAIFVETYYDVLYFSNNKFESAVFEIESQVGKVIDFTIRYGFDELPNWDKKLSELPLEETAITDVYTHALAIISQTWPNVNYNYPQIHTEKYDAEEETWSTFLFKLNNYNGNLFEENTFTAVNFANRNIMQPTPYFLHILTQGFLDAGYGLKGDVTTDETFKKLCVFTDLDYFDLVNESQIKVFLNYEEGGSILPNGNARYYTEVNLGTSKNYKIEGLTRFIQFFSSSYPATFSRITYKGTDLFLKEGHPTSNYGTFEYDVNIEFSTNSDAENTQILEIEVETGNSYFVSVMDILIEEVLATGELPPSEVHVKNEVNLKNVVPDITFGAFITILKNWFNIDLYIEGKDVYMNFIENEINYNNAADLRSYEVLKPQKDRRSKESYLLKFSGDDEDVFSVVFQNREGVELSESNVDNYTNTIEIDAFPLPQKNIEGIETAFAFDQGGESKLYAVLYNGLNESGLNLTQDVNPILLPNIHTKHYKKWFSLRINAIAYSWSFKMFAEDLENIVNKVFAYNRYHIVKTLNPTEISEDLFEVEIETETLE